jgi:hypothetical protein
MGECDQGLGAIGLIVLAVGRTAFVRKPDSNQVAV